MTHPPAPLAAEHQAILVRVARDSIEHGLRWREPLPIVLEHYPAELQAPGGIFVTLELEEELRGCVGTLESAQPRVVNTAKYAYAAAFSDSRFPPVTRSELPRLRIRISLLSELEPLAFASEAQLLAQVRPGEDGLVLEEGGCRGTLLPSVWQDIPEPREFVRRLKLKAGLPADYWSDRIRVHRYTTCCFP